MPLDLQQDIRGLQELQREAERITRELHGEPMLDAMRQSSLWVQTDAKQLCPVDTGRLRASITPDIRVERHQVIGVVGTNVLYGPYVETGTRPHWPPKGALAVWAQRHGMDEQVAARTIARRGTRAKPYFKPAFEQNIDRIQNAIGQAVEGIISAK